jgi:hypothetical protein
MATRCAFVTLITSDSYLPGALTLAAALREIHPSPAVEPEVDFQTACLVTPETVDVSSIKLLRGAFDVVIGVEIIEDDDRKGLELLGECCCSISEAREWGEAVWRTAKWISTVSWGTLPPVCDSLPDGCYDNPSDVRESEGHWNLVFEPNLIDIEPFVPSLSSDTLLQDDPISAPPSPNFTRSGSLSSPKSSTSIPMSCPFDPSLTCSSWTTSFLLHQTSAGRIFSILE